jgi:hypothetical protein
VVRLALASRTAGEATAEAEDDLRGRIEAGPGHYARLGPAYDPEVVSTREEKPWEHPYTKTTTLIYNPAANEQIAWIDGAIWPPVGSVIELGDPNRDAIVIGTRLQLGPKDDRAVILVDVRELEDWDFVPRHAADRILDEEG